VHLFTNYGEGRSTNASAVAAVVLLLIVVGKVQRFRQKVWCVFQSRGKLLNIARLLLWLSSDTRCIFMISQKNRCWYQAGNNSSILGDILDADIASTHDFEKLQAPENV
jgi:hypothetical protein